MRGVTVSRSNQKTGIPKWVALVSGNMDQTCGLPLLFNFEPHPDHRGPGLGFRKKRHQTL